MKQPKKNKPKVKVEELDQPVIDWHGSNTYIKTPPELVQAGEEPVSHLGTVIMINNQIIALKPYTDMQLDRLEKVVLQAISHEREFRKKPKENN